MGIDFSFGLKTVRGKFGNFWKVIQAKFATWGKFTINDEIF